MTRSELCAAGPALTVAPAGSGATPAAEGEGGAAEPAAQNSDWTHRAARLRRLGRRLSLHYWPLYWATPKGSPHKVRYQRKLWRASRCFRYALDCDRRAVKG